MKRFERTKGFIFGVILTLVASATIPVFAKSIEAVFNSANIKINGKQIADKGQFYKLPNGTEVPFSIIYQGTTYLPLRKIGELYDKNIIWDGITSTVSINDNINEPASEQARVTCTVNYDKESDGTYTVTVTASGGSGSGKYAIGYGKTLSDLSYFIPVDKEDNPLTYHKFTGVQPGSTWYFGAFKQGDSTFYNSLADVIPFTAPVNEKKQQTKVTCTANYAKESDGTYTITVTASGGSGSGKYAIGYGETSSNLSYFIPVDEEENPLYYHRFTGVQAGSTWYFGAFKQGDGIYYDSPADVVQLTAPIK